MSILAINTASSQTGIALFEVLSSIQKTVVPGDEIQLLAENSWPAKNDEAEKLMPTIAGLLESTNKRSTSPSSSFSFSDIKQIYVIKGPGSFTGLRVGVTVANTLAYLNNCELFGLTTFEYWHAANNIASRQSATNIPVLVYAGSGGVYLSKNSHSKPELINLTDLNEKLQYEKVYTVTGDISPTQITTLKNVKFIKSKKTFGEIMQMIIVKNLQKHNLKADKIIQPLYIKEPGITQSKKHL